MLRVDFVFSFAEEYFGLVVKWKTKFFPGSELMLSLTAKLGGGLLAASQVKSTLIHYQSQSQQ